MILKVKIKIVKGRQGSTYYKLVGQFSDSWLKTNHLTGVEHRFQYSLACSLEHDFKHRFKPVFKDGSKESFENGFEAAFEQKKGHQQE